MKHTLRQTWPLVAGALLAAIILIAMSEPPQASAGQGPVGHGRYQVLEPLEQGNLTIFPVVAASVHDARGFLTLDEGLRSGEVVVTEAGRANPMVRRPGTSIPRGDGAEVNRLVLVNNSSRPLLLLAGEIVSGGKQDRVVGKDRIVPAGTEADLNVFCVEPGRWVANSAHFGTKDFAMLQPSVRGKAMADKDQQKVWDSVRASNEGLKQRAEVVMVESGGDSSYSSVANDRKVLKKVDEVATPMQRSYQDVIGKLRERNAVGVVVAVNGRIIWADMFASTGLLEKYWPKLVRSYAAEAVVTAGYKSNASLAAAQAFVDDLEGRHSVSESEPGVYRQTESSGPGYKVFTLTSLLPGTGFDLHQSKMAEL